jgi:hypothetical protein
MYFQYRIGRNVSGRFLHSIWSWYSHLRIISMIIVIYKEEFRSQESEVRSQNDKCWGVETFPKTLSLYGWCILTPDSFLFFDN